MDKRPNFYQILDLSPVLHDWPTIEATILSKQREWGLHRNQGSPKQRRQGEKYSLLIKDMTEYLKSPENVKTELKLFKQQQTSAKQAALAKLDDLIGSITNKVVPKNLLKKLVQGTDKQFTEQEVEQRLIKKGYQVQGKEQGKEQSSKTKPIEQLEASVAKEISEQLNTIELNSLYQLLSLAQDAKLNARSSALCLFERADQLYKQLSATGKTDQKTTVKKQLSGHAKSVFKSEQEKVRYDNTLALQVVEQLNPYLEVAGIDGFIETTELQSLMAQAKQRHIDPDIAMRHIEAVATKRKWGIQRQSTAEKTPLLQCGHCDTLAKSANDKRCRDCGEELIQPCPHCAHPTPTEQAACGQCGCHTGDVTVVKPLYKQSQLAINKGALTEALELTERVLHYWPKWQDALNQQKQLKTTIKQQAAIISEVQTLVRVKKFEAAQAKLLSAEAMQSVETAGLTKTIQQGLAQATGLYEAAQKLSRSGKPDQAFDQYEAALSHCADHTLSKQAMAKSPPPPPSALSARWIGATLRLSWTPPKAKGQLNYQVVRKLNGVPANLQDGHVVGQVSANQIDDSEVKTGNVYYYAVFTLRGGASALHSLHCGPHLLVANVTKLSYQTGDKQVAIKWLKPNGCQAVEIWRAPSGTPLKRGQGKQLAVSGDSVLDTNLTNGNHYDYLVLAKFVDPKRPQHFIYANGAQFSATPMAPAKPVTDLVATRQGQQVILNWSASNGPGHIELRQTQQLPAFTPGQVISLSDAAKCGKLIPATAAGQAQTTIDKQGRLYFIPLTVLEQSVTVGTPAQLTTLDDVTHIVSRRQGKSISLTWQWPTGASQVQVSYRHDQFPQDANDPMAVSYLIDKAEYDSQQFYTVRHAEQKKHYFTLFVHDPSAGIYSKGTTLLEAMGQESTVRYQVTVERRLFSRRPKAAWIELTYQSGKILNGLTAVMKPMFPPTSKDDGVKLIQVAQLRFMANVARIDIPGQFLDSKGYVKLFFDNDEAVKEVRLLPMAKEKLRIA